MKKLYSVLTCIFDDYEMVREPINPSPLCEYVLVTDNPNLQSNYWDIQVFNCPQNWNGSTKSAYVKYHPFEFVNSDAVLWIDGSVQVKDDLTPMMYDFLSSGKSLAEVINICNNNAYNESARWEHFAPEWGRGDQSIFHKVQTFFEQQNYDIDPNSKNGMVQTTVYACRNNRLVNNINGITWRLMMDLGDGTDCAREYMSIRSYVVNTQIDNLFDHFILYSPTILWCKYLDYCFHKTNTSQCDYFCKDDPTVYRPEDYNKLQSVGFNFHNTFAIPVYYPY